MQLFPDKVQEVFLHKKCNNNIMRGGGAILASATEVIIDEKWLLIHNQSTCNALINGNIYQNQRCP